MPDWVDLYGTPEIVIHWDTDGWPEVRPTWLPEWLPRIFGAFELFPCTGAPLRNRTVDLLLTMETLCRLS